MILWVHPLGFRAVKNCSCLRPLHLHLLTAAVPPQARFRRMTFQNLMWQEKRRRTFSFNRKLRFLLNKHALQGDTLPYNEDRQMKKTGFYIIRDQFFEDMSDPYLKGNKAGNRPHYYCSEDTGTGIYCRPVSIPLESLSEKREKLWRRHL